MLRKSLRTLYEEHSTGKLAHKWGLYLDVYDRLFNPFRDRPVDLVEVGVQNGGSLEIWLQYFPRAHRIVGCDINPRCAALRYSDPRISVVVGPINERATSEQIIRHAPEFDIFIDDGSHTSADINATFYNYFHRVRPGGLFVIEDLHCAYFPAYGGGLDAPGGSMGFLRVLADAIHKDYWQEKISLAERVAPYLPPGTPVDDSLTADILGISFYDSVCVIEKRAIAKPAGLGPEVIVGDTAAVDPGPLEVRRQQRAEALRAAAAKLPAA
jgi:hypothetical protein